MSTSSIIGNVSSDERKCGLDRCNSLRRLISDPKFPYWPLGGAREFLIRSEIARTKTVFIKEG